jgi:hypothetical protein
MCLSKDNKRLTTISIVAWIAFCSMTQGKEQLRWKQHERCGVCRLSLFLHSWSLDSLLPIRWTGCVQSGWQGLRCRRQCDWSSRKHQFCRLARRKFGASGRCGGSQIDKEEKVHLLVLVKRNNKGYTTVRAVVGRRRGGYLVLGSGDPTPLNLCGRSSSV